MFTHSTRNSYATRVFAGLVICVSIAFGSLTYAVSNIQAYA